MWLVIHKNDIGTNNWSNLSGPVKIWTEKIFAMGLHCIFADFKNFFKHEIGDESIK